MAVLHKKEEKIQAVLGRLPKTYTHDEFVAMFIKLYSKDWGKIKSAYIKQSQDREPGTVINMPKPELYLKQVLAGYLAQKHVAEPVVVVEEIKVEAKKAPVKKEKAVAKEKVETPDEVVAVKKPRVASKKKEAVDTDTAPVKKVKAAVKK